MYKVADAEMHRGECIVLRNTILTDAMSLQSIITCFPPMNFTDLNAMAFKI
jgi:hypothetical protein